MARRAPASTKADLLLAAEECFVSQGLDATKIEEITARTGIAKGAFYSYFVSKEACFKEIVDAFLVRLSAVIDQHDAALGSRAPLPERLEIWLAHDLEVFDFCWDNRQILGLLLHGAGAATYAHLLDEFARRATSNAQALVRAMMDEGFYAEDLDPELAGAMLGGAYDRLAREVVRAKRKPDLEALVRKAQRVLLHGLLSDESRKAVEPRHGPRHESRHASRHEPKKTSARGSAPKPKERLR